MVNTPIWQKSSVEFHKDSPGTIAVHLVCERPTWMINEMQMFADDIKIWTVIKKKEDSISLQNDLSSHDSRSQKWLLGLNAEKCKVMHVGHS